ncbi:MAG: hypothetical protein Kow0056_08370 [Coriobacteriia bacterium]
MTDAYDYDALIVEFSTYDQYVDVVCCWHGWFEGYVGQGQFDHYPSRDLPSGKTVTPDFVVDFNSYTLVGEVCRLPNQPEGFASSVDQAVGYLDISDQTDVMLLVPHTTAAESEKRMVDEGLLMDEQQIVVVGFVRNTDAKPCWVFNRATQLRPTTFRDQHLGDKSLDRILTQDMRSISIPIRRLFPMRDRFPFMNDDPPAIFTACYLWQFVFNQLLSEDEYLKRGVSGESLDIEGVTVQDLCNTCARNGIRMRVSWVRSAMSLLVDAGLAERTEGDTYHIFYGKLRALSRGSHELHQQIAERLSKSRASESAEDEVSPDQMSMDLDAI